MKIEKGAGSRRDRRTGAKSLSPRQEKKTPRPSSIQAPRKKESSGRTARHQTSLGKPLPDFLPFALCAMVTRPPNGPDSVHEIKLDGWRSPTKAKGRLAEFDSYALNRAVQRAA